MCEWLQHKRYSSLVGTTSSLYKEHTFLQVDRKIMINYNPLCEFIYFRNIGRYRDICLKFVWFIFVNKLKRKWPCYSWYLGWFLRHEKLSILSFVQTSNFKFPLEMTSCFHNVYSHFLILRRNFLPSRRNFRAFCRPRSAYAHKCLPIPPIRA